jgi:hypothetical protein
MPNAPRAKARAAPPEFVPESGPSESTVAGSARTAEPTFVAPSQPAESTLAGSSQPESAPFGPTHSAESIPFRAPRTTDSSGPSHTWQPDSFQSFHPRGSSPTISSRPPGSGSSSSAQLAQGQGASEGGEPLKEDERQASLKELESFTSQFRDRRITKTTALAGIISIIVKLSLSEREKDQTIKLYTEELESIRHGNEPRLPQMGRDRPSVNPTLPLRVERASLAAISADGSQAADSDDDLDGPRKKRKLTASDFPWYEADSHSLLALPASCIQTCKRLEVYLQDIPGCRNQIKVAPGAPRNVPISQWERIFRGETLDLDHFLSSLHRTTVDEEGETRIGSARISFGVADAKRRVNSASDWASAWRLASKAVSFVFPHRADELYAYSDYIDGQFSAKVASSHPRVIMFDIAARNLVQGGQSCLLTDFHAFSHLHSAILMPDGAESAPRRSANNRRSNPSSRASGSKPDICNRFNTSLGCPSSDSDCRYRHVCKSCKKPGHGRDQCPK